MNIFQNLQGVFRKDKQQMRAPQSNIGLYSRQQNNQTTSPNRTQTTKPNYGMSSSNFYNPQSSQQRQTFRIVQPKPTPAPAPQRPQATGMRGSGQFGISPAVSGIRAGQTSGLGSPTPQLDRVRQMGQPRMSMEKPSVLQSRTTQQQSQPQQEVQSSPFDSLSQFYNDSEKRRLGIEEEMLGNDMQTINSTYGAAGEALSRQLPVLQENFGKFKEDVMAGVADEEAGTIRDIESARTESGAAQRELAESRRDLQGTRERQYAGLNSIDSYGAGSFTQANTNDDNNFLRMTNENLQKRADKIAGIETGLRQFKRQAQTMINSENAKLQERVMQIQADMTMNEVEKESMIRQAYTTAKANKQSVMDEYNGYRLQLAQEKSTYEKELAGGGLSPEFISTGKPVTAKDFEFFVKNPKGIEAFQKMGGVADNGDKSRINASIDELLSRNIGEVTGYGQYNPLNAAPGSAAQYTRAQLDQLKGLLSLDAREKLKGQGTITDAEMAMLDRSVAALNSNLSEQDMRTELQKIKSILNKGTQGTPASSRYQIIAE